jgi:cytoskeletal protein CcmA (bactofilin family)
MFRRNRPDEIGEGGLAPTDGRRLDDDEIPPLQPLMRESRESPGEMPLAEAVAAATTRRAMGQAGEPPANPQQPTTPPERFGLGAPDRGATGGRDVGSPERRVYEPLGGLPVKPNRANAGDEARKLIVGQEIRLSGEISSCAHLVVEGTVEATLTDSRVIDITESGAYKGKAEVDDADIAGAFDGELVVRNLLLIRGTGRVTGTVRYRQLQVECGGQVTGDIRHEAAEAAPRPRPAEQPERDPVRPMREEPTANIIARSQELAGNGDSRTPRRAG